MERLRSDAHRTGVLAHREQALELALSSFGDAIRICNEQGWSEEAADSTLHVAEILANQEEFQLAARFLGLTIWLRGQSRSSQEEDDLRRTGGLARKLRGMMGFEDFDLACAEASAMSLGDARSAIASMDQGHSQVSPR